MKKNDKITNAARVRKLETMVNEDQAAGKPALIVDWDDTPDSELEPGTLVIEWGPNDQIISHRVKREDSTDGKRDAKTS